MPPARKTWCGGKHPAAKVGHSFGTSSEMTDATYVVFRVPTTHDVLTLFNPLYPKSHIDLLNLALLGFQIVLFFLLPRSASKVFFFLYFAFWRAAYDVGLGWVLTKQSKKKWIVKEVQRLGWLDEKRCPEIRNWIRKQLAGKMGKDYSFDVCPLRHMCRCTSHTSQCRTGTPFGVQYMATFPSSGGHHPSEVCTSFPSTDHRS